MNYETTHKSVGSEVTSRKINGICNQFWLTYSVNTHISSSPVTIMVVNHCPLGITSGSASRPRPALNGNLIY